MSLKIRPLHESFGAEILGVDIARELAYVLRKEKVMDRGLRTLIQELGRAARS